MRFKLSMNTSNENQIQQLKIDKNNLRRRRGGFWSILFAILVIILIVVYFAIPRKSDLSRVNRKSVSDRTQAIDVAKKESVSIGNTNITNITTGNEPVLTVSGYIVARERIELSPRFLGIVKWIGVKKGDAVTNGQVIVILDDTEYVKKLKEAEARLESARIALQKAQIEYDRIKPLVDAGVEMKKYEDDALLELMAARSSINEIEQQIELLKTYIDWTVIRSPINGIVLEKLVDANELVTPQSFGGSRGPSTAVVALADLNDLQIEIDLNETDLAKVYLNQKCKVYPEAYPERVYDGIVAEIAPEANRQKGTLQVKVQVLRPDRYLIPELSAKVDFQN